MLHQRYVHAWRHTPRFSTYTKYLDDPYLKSVGAYFLIAS
jgi:hypothetical protein